MTFWNKETNLETLLPFLKEELDAGRSVRFSPRGTSMLPLLRPGTDSVELSPPPAVLKKYDLPLYRRADGSFVLHRVVGIGQGYTCMGDNQFAPETGVPHERVLAVVSAVFRGEKRIPVTDFSYGCYCRIWHITRPFRRVCRKLRRLLLRSKENREVVS